MAKTRSQSQEAPPKLTIGSLTKSQRKKLQNISSKYEIWYTLGVLNLLVTAVVAVRFPAYFWIYYFLKILYYVPYRYYRFEKKNWELYLLDWCYVVNYISDICVLLAGLRTTFGIKTPLYPYNADLIRAGFSMACGPLASSVYIFRNSIVFYDVDHSTSVFIHLAPFILMWCLRFAAGHGPGLVHNVWPEMFHVCASPQEYDNADKCMNTWRGVVWCHACSAPLSSFVVPPAILYIFVWAAPYFCYIFVWKQKFIATTNKQTLYTFLIASHSGLESFFQRYFGMFGKKYAGPVGYMTCHFAWTMTLAAASYLLWHSYLLYTCVFLFILVTAIHNGSTYMFRVFAYRFVEEQLANHASVIE